jgi:DNA-binding transcriptional LysR family regulator
MAVIAPRSAPGENARQVLASNPFLRFDRTQRTGLQIDRLLRRLAVPLNEFLELNAIETLVELVRQEVGVTLLPLIHGSNWQQSPELRILYLPRDLGPLSRSIGMLERREHARQAITAAICAACAAAFRERGAQTAP